MLSCTPLPTRMFPQKFPVPFDLGTYALVAQPLRCHVVSLSSAVKNLDSKILRRKEENFMAKGFFLWLLGIPFGLIVVLWLFGFLT